MHTSSINLPTILEESAIYQPIGMALKVQ